MDCDSLTKMLVKRARNVLATFTIVATTNFYYDSWLMQLSSVLLYQQKYLSGS